MTLTHRTLVTVAIAASFSAVATAQTSGPDWPQWRGPNRDGAVASFTPPKVWPERLTLKWKVDVGEGYATPVLVGTRVYMFTRQNENEFMRALDAATGKVIWETRYPAPFTMNPSAKPHGPGPKSTPTFANGRLYTLGMSGIVTAFDAATGRQLWQKPAPPVGPLYGTGMSPLVDRGLVIVHVGGHGQGALTAFDANTGDVKWSWNGDGPSYASPVVADIEGTRQVITFTQDNLVGVSAATGELMWSRPYTTGFTQNIITPIVSGQTVIVSGFQKPITAFRIARKNNRWVTEDVWENPEASLYMTNAVMVRPSTRSASSGSTVSSVEPSTSAGRPGPVEGRDALFGLSQRNSGQYFLIDVKTGKTLWTSMPRQGTNAAIVRAGDLLFVLEDDAELLVGRTSPAGFEILRRYTVAEAATWAQPAISGNRVFIKDVSTLALWTLN